MSGASGCSLFFGAAYLHARCHDAPVDCDLAEIGRSCVGEDSPASGYPLVCDYVYAGARKTRAVHDVADQEQGNSRVSADIK